MTTKTYREAVHSNFSRNFVEHAAWSSAVSMQHCIQACLRRTSTTAAKTLQYVKI